MTFARAIKPIAKRPINYGVTYSVPTLHALQCHSFQLKSDALAYIRKVCRVHGIGKKEFEEKYLPTFKQISDAGLMSASIDSKNGWSIFMRRAYKGETA